MDQQAGDLRFSHIINFKLTGNLKRPKHCVEDHMPTSGIVNHHYRDLKSLPENIEFPGTLTLDLKDEVVYPHLGEARVLPGKKAHRSSQRPSVDRPQAHKSPGNQPPDLFSSKPYRHHDLRTSAAAYVPQVSYHGSQQHYFDRVNHPLPPYGSQHHQTNFSFGPGNYSLPPYQTNFPSASGHNLHPPYDPQQQQSVYGFQRPHNYYNPQGGGGGGGYLPGPQQMYNQQAHYCSTPYQSQYPQAQGGGHDLDTGDPANWGYQHPRPWGSGGQEGSSGQ